MRAAFVLGLLVCSGAIAACSAKCVANPGHPLEEGTLEEMGACRTCSADNSTCVECWGMFSLNNKTGECVECKGSYCIACDPEKPSVCQECGDYWGEAETGFYALDNGTCVACPAENCMECLNGNGTCIGCTTGMGAVDGQCLSCKDKEACLFCNGDLGVCSECMSGYLLDNSTGTCKKCPANCDKCSSTDKCTECSSNGYVLDPKTSQCVRCIDGCDSCSTTTTCDNCQTGWTKMPDGTCGRCKDKHCTTCSVGKPDHCEICAFIKPGWVGGPNEDGSACIPCIMDHCSACQTSYKKCDWCDDGYFNDAKKMLCTPCKDRWEHCTSCGMDATHGDPGIPACFGCEDGWETDPKSKDGKCKKVKKGGKS